MNNMKFGDIQKMVYDAVETPMAILPLGNLPGRSYIVVRKNNDETYKIHICNLKNTNLSNGVSMTDIKETPLTTELLELYVSVINAVNSFYEEDVIKYTNDKIIAVDNTSKLMATMILFILGDHLYKMYHVKPSETILTTYEYGYCEA